MFVMSSAQIITQLFLKASVQRVQRYVAHRNQRSMSCFISTSYSLMPQSLEVKQSQARFQQQRGHILSTVSVFD